MIYCGCRGGSYQVVICACKLGIPPRLQDLEPHFTQPRVAENNDGQQSFPQTTLRRIAFLSSELVCVVTAHHSCLYSNRNEEYPLDAFFATSKEPISYTFPSHNPHYILVQNQQFVLQFCGGIYTCSLVPSRLNLFLIIGD